MKIRKALSIKQPWLYCINHHGKCIENRSWVPPEHIQGQRIALHCSKKMDRPVSVHSASKLAETDMPDELILGAITSTAIVAGWVSTSGGYSHQHLEEYINNKWFFGPYGWVLKDIKILDHPIYCNGALGIWKVRHPFDAR